MLPFCSVKGSALQLSHADRQLVASNALRSCLFCLMALQPVQLLQATQAKLYTKKNIGKETMPGCVTGPLQRASKHCRGNGHQKKAHRHRTKCMQSKAGCCCASLYRFINRCHAGTLPAMQSYVSHIVPAQGLCIRHIAMQASMIEGC